MRCLKVPLNICTFLLLLSAICVLSKDKLKEAPCHFDDTIKLDSIENATDPKRTGYYNIDIVNGVKKIIDKPYPRECVCDKQPCIQICCYNEIFEEDKCVVFDEQPYDEIKVKYENGTEDYKSIYDFKIQYSRPCQRMYTYTEEFIIFENGSLSINATNEIFPRSKFCMNPELYDGIFEYFPALCYLPDPPGSEERKIAGIVTLTSVPFMLSTIFTTVISRKSTLSRQLTCFYLSCLSVAFITLSFINLDIGQENFCSVLGYTTYFTFMASYAWITIMSFDIYISILSNPNLMGRCKALLRYSLFGFGLPTLLLAIVLVIDNCEWIDTKFKPNIAGRNNCFFEATEYNKLIYFYLPGMILESFNVLMFLLTVSRINYKQATDQLDNKINYKRKLRHYLKRCGFYLQLFLITGIAWAFEFLSYLFPGVSFFNFFYYVIQVQGFMIFLLTVVINSNSRKSLKIWIFKLLGLEHLLANQRTKNSSLFTRRTMLSSQI